VTWHKAGITGVDAGMILITDPCYVVRNPGDHQYEPYRSWEALWAHMPGDGASHQITNEFSAEVGVIVTNFGGDGVYPVYVETDFQGQVVAAMIRFDGRRPMPYP
jgi:hypothetical protein